jgi:hypothetical protein
MLPIVCSSLLRVPFKGYLIHVDRSSDIILIFPGVNRTSILAKSSTAGSIEHPHFSLGSHQIGFSRKITRSRRSIEYLSLFPIKMKCRSHSVSRRESGEQVPKCISTFNLKNLWSIFRGKAVHLFSKNHYIRQDRI